MACLLTFLAASASSGWLYWPLWAAAWLAFLTWIACLPIAALKGKWRMAVVDLFFTLFVYIGAVRLAKPGSLWARRFYSDEKLRRALVRYSRRAALAPPAVPRIL
jgi:hypothetical protein